MVLANLLLDFSFSWIDIIFSFVVISRRVSFVLVLRNTIKCGQRQWHRKKRRALWLLAPLSALHKGNAFSHLIAFPTCVLYVFFFTVLTQDKQQHSIIPSNSYLWNCNDLRRFHRRRLRQLATTQQSIATIYKQVFYKSITKMFLFSF